MMSLTQEQVRMRAEAWRAALGQGDVISSKSAVGGGSLPDECIATFVLALKIRSPDKFLKKLRESRPPVIARVEDDTILFDPRTVLDDALLLAILKSLLTEKE
jgi:L-seryl-tRNA(Ser) seleniumtransferase